MISILKKYISKIFFITIITLLVLIALKKDSNLRSLFYQKVYVDNFSFAKLNSWYSSKFGSPLPFSDLIKDTAFVFNEELKYDSAHKYKDGVELDVGIEYLTPSLDNGIVIFIGEKEGYGQTVIVQQENGIDVWYSNISEVNVKLYDYITKGSLIGNVNEKLYLVFIKDGEVINYEDYI